MFPVQTRKFFPSIFLAILIAALVGSCSVLNRPPEFNGAVYASPAPPPDFTLPSTRGGEFTLSAQEDVVTLIYFGYTFCPDICPQTLGLVRSALERLDPEERARIELVFVSVDPARDSLPVMAAYLSRFDPSFFGVLPDPAALDGLVETYDAYAAPDLPDAETAAYEVSHSSVVYVLDKRGDLRLGFFNGMDPGDMASDLRVLVRE